MRQLSADMGYSGRWAATSTAATLPILSLPGVLSTRAAAACYASHANQHHHHYCVHSAAAGRYMLPHHPFSRALVLLLLLGVAHGAPKIGRVQERPQEHADIYDPAHPDQMPRPRSNSGWGRHKQAAPNQPQTLKMDADGNLYDDTGFQVAADAGGWPLDGFKPGVLKSQQQRAESSSFPRVAGAALSDAECRSIAQQGKCENEGCYWSSDSRKCYVKYVLGSEGTYAQNFQDWWVRKVAEHNKWNRGFFLDLGAHSGIYCSNTKLLETKLNWSGVCVEPFPENGPSKGSFRERTCRLVQRALTGSIDGQVRSVSII